MNQLFLVVFALLVIAQLWWGIRTLPRENWQILAAIPRQQGADGTWQGINFTYYGLFNANAYVLAALLFLILLRSAGAGVEASLVAILTIIGCCAPASRLIARLVEKKPSTFTVGGASFVGLLLAPPLFGLLTRVSAELGQPPFPTSPALAALAIAYALGEGLGRLACLSFGCCYGRHLESCHLWLQRLFRHHHVRFVGPTRKSTYEGKLDGQPLVPVQAITCCLYTFTALAGLYLFLRGSFVAAFLIPLWVTQLWRVGSEFLRADYRGGGRLSAYQLMALSGVVYGSVVSSVLPANGSVVVNLLQAGGVLWNPAAILLLQVSWLAIFAYTGKSMITGSRITFHVNRHLT